MSAKDDRWKPNNNQLAFIRTYGKHIDEGRAAVFVGAGLSRSAGFVDWRELLKEIAEELGLDITREHDLVAIAQFYLNTKNNRSKLNDTLVERFSAKGSLTRNHYLLARLPVRYLWTTNYDQLIEKAFADAGRVVDAKRIDEDFALNRGGDTNLYKMHGDVSNPSAAVLTKDDYDKYAVSHPVFLQHLKLDLLTKHFLFMGFSFTDPNLDHILRTARDILGPNGPQHYAIFHIAKDGDEFVRRRTSLWLDDLKRFNIEPILIDDYKEITKILETLSLHVNRKNVFVSGSFRKPRARMRVPAFAADFSRILGAALITEGYNVVSGFGLGVGENVILGALHALHFTTALSERVTIRPFPGHLERSEQLAINTQVRNDLISRAGAAIFVGGGHLTGGVLYPSKGVLEEFEIARQMSRLIIPVSVTGAAATIIWKLVKREFNYFYPRADRTFRKRFEQLTDPSLGAEDLAKVVLAMLHLAASPE